MDYPFLVAMVRAAKRSVKSDPDVGRDLGMMGLYAIRVAAEEAAAAEPSALVGALETAMDRASTTSTLVAPLGVLLEFRGTTPSRAIGSTQTHPVMWASAFGCLAPCLRSEVREDVFRMWPIRPMSREFTEKLTPHQAATLALLGAMCDRIYELVHMVFMPASGVLRSPSARGIEAAAKAVIGCTAVEAGLPGKMGFGLRDGGEYATDNILRVTETTGTFSHIDALHRLAGKILAGAAHGDLKMTSWGRVGRIDDLVLMEELYGEDVTILNGVLKMAAHALVRAVTTRLHGDPERQFYGVFVGRSVGAPEKPEITQ